MDINFPIQYQDRDTATSFMLWQLSHLHQRSVNSKLKNFGLTYLQLVLLVCLVWGKKVGNISMITQVLLAKSIHMDIMMTSNVLRTLEKKGLVSRKEHPVDSRAKILNVTKKGYKVASDALNKFEEIDQEFYKILTKKEHNTLNRILNKLLTANSEEWKNPPYSNMLNSE